ncbi:MAG: PQQ-binding-like beta-propeller repeat protein [Pyrinomonadaceae bacterium]
MTFKKFFIISVVLLGPGSGFTLGRAQNKPVTARKVSASARIQWKAQSQVSRYRLQVARDEGFTDMVIDKAVSGTGYVISGLPEGTYYWRVAAIGGEGGNYSSARSVRLVKPVPKPKPKEAGETANAKKPAKPVENAGKSKGVTTSRSAGRTSRANSDSAAKQIRTARVTRPPNQKPRVSISPSRDEGARTTAMPPIAVAPKLLPDNGGWRTITGNIAYPAAAHLRSPSSFDLIGVNSNGTVYALDGANGSALWTTRLRLSGNVVEPASGAANTFVPVVFAGHDGLANVIVAFDDGVRALAGDTGAELWRANLPGGALSGVAVEASPNQRSTVFIVSGTGQELLLLDGDSGAIIGKSALLAKPFGPPIAFVSGNARSLALVFNGGFVESRNMKGEIVRTVKLESPTTPPVFVAGPKGGLILVGTQNGLMALDASGLNAVGRVAIEDDWPRGKLSVDDMDGDGAPEVVMITNRARVVAINTTDGKIRWEANGATDAASAAFADLDGDGVLDVLVAAWPAFAVAYSGRDGSLIWRADEEMNPAARLPFAAGRSLVTASVEGGSKAIVAGTDSYRKGFRAVGLPKGALRIARR